MIPRKDVPIEDRWHVDALYSSLDAWQSAYQQIAPPQETLPNWPELHALQGTLSQGPEHMLKALESLFRIDRELSKLYTYAHLRHDEDIADPLYKGAYERILSLFHAFSQASAWFQPELLSLSEEILASYLSSPLLTPYRFHLEKLIRLKPHTLSREEETVIAMAGQSLHTAHKTFSALNDADFKFAPVHDSQGESRPLSHASYALYLRDRDRLLRREAFETYHQHYAAYENTLCELLNGQMQNHLFQARVHRFPSCLEAALFPKNIPVSVYHALIGAVRERIDVLHRYMDLRKRVLQLDSLHAYDLYVPLTPSVEMRMPYAEAEQLVIESVAPLGPEYQTILHQGLKEGRWVDRYENQNKRSGAYSSGCYDSMPYILMNYKNLLRDVFTLAHEAGHSMHSLYSRTTQPYHYSDYPIFLAEVASTFNEDLLSRLLIQRATERDHKIFLINQQLEDIRSTLFRQTLFAEFELLLHQHVERGTPLTPQLLKDEYRLLNATYFGSAVHIDEALDIEWARIPHFYYNFYVFQYATGISAALALSKRVVTGGEIERHAYLNFLKGGCSRYPIEMLREAGVDMTSATPVQAAIQLFETRLIEMEQLLNEIGNQK